MLEASPQERARVGYMRADRYSACASDAPREKTWAEVEELGKVRLVKGRGWCVEFRTVYWPGQTKPRRVFVTHDLYGERFDSEASATREQMRIHAWLVSGSHLHDVLTRYISDVPENRVLWRYEHQFLKVMRLRNEAGDLSDERMRHLEQYVQRGYFDFWKPTAMRLVDATSGENWVHALRQLKREDGTPRLTAGGLRHVVNDFGAFLRFMAKIGALTKVPELPVIKPPKKIARIPEMHDIQRILDHIPLEERGIFMARSLAGRRMSEARRYNVSDYDFERGELRVDGAINKTDEPILLPIREVVPELDAWLCEHRAHGRPWEPLFVNPRGQGAKRWKEHAERNAWEAAIAAAGLEYVSQNLGGRHTFGTEMVQRVGVFAVQQWMQHTSAKTTERYIHLRSSALARMMKPATVEQSRNSKKRGPKSHAKSTR